jgi:thioredoxin-like negative regulator of GroEL
MTPDARPLLVFFSSSRSGPSRRMESLVAHIARKERHRLRVMQVDVDQRADLVAKLSVSHVPTLVLVVARKAVARIDGRTSAPKIEAMLGPHLAPEPLATSGPLAPEPLAPQPLAL